MMKVEQLDLADGYANGAGPLALCLQRLQTLLHCPGVEWAPEQRAAATRDLAAARDLLGADVLQLAARATNERHMHRGEFVRAQIDHAQAQDCGHVHARRERAVTQGAAR